MVFRVLAPYTNPWDSTISPVENIIPCYEGTGHLLGSPGGAPKSGVSPNCVVTVGACLARRRSLKRTWSSPKSANKSQYLQPASPGHSTSGQHGRHSVRSGRVTAPNPFCRERGSSGLYGNLLIGELPQYKKRKRGRPFWAALCMRSPSWRDCGTAPPAVSLLEYPETTSPF